MLSNKHRDPVRQDDPSFTSRSRRRLVVDTTRDLWTSTSKTSRQSLARKRTDHIAYIAAVFTLMNDLTAIDVTKDAMRCAAVLKEFYLGEALRLSNV